MAITFTRQVVTTGTGSTSLINNNFAAIQTALANAVSRAGGASNSMNADLDMNSYSILNVTSGPGLNDLVTRADLLAASIATTTDTVQDLIDAVIADIDLQDVADLVVPTITIASLSDYSANKYVDHTGVTITAGTGLSGGGTIAANRTIDLDLTELSTATDIDVAADFIPYYDTSSSTHKKALPTTFLGDALGDGKYKLSGNQSLSAATDTVLQFNTLEYDELTRGTFNTSTYRYTAAVDTRVLVTVNATVTALDAGASFKLSLYVNNSSMKAYHVRYNEADATALEQSISFSLPVSLALGDYIQVKAQTSSAETVDSTLGKTYIGIIELA